MKNQDWVDDAVCAQVDSELFFPDTPGTRATEARAICRSCPVIQDCLDWALRHGESGVWGATTDNERKLLRRKLRIRVTPTPTPILHGTPAGARAHNRRGENACPSCRKAQSQRRYG